MLELIYRTIIIYFTLIFFMRIMGKREMGQLSAIDFVVSIVIAELAAIPISNTKIPLIHGILPIAMISLAQISLSILCLKSNVFRRVIYGMPNILIANGIIQRNEMRKARYNTDDLLTQLREKDVFNVADVEFAVLETSGELTVSLKPSKKPLAAEDLKIRNEYEGIPLTLIDDGEVNIKGLEDAKLSRDWLEKELKRRDIDRIEDVFFASLSPNGVIYLIKKDLDHKNEKKMH